MDENFLKDRDRALELLSEMEHHRRFFRFHIFSSAEAITAFGLDNLVRLGVDLVWIGFESRSRQSAFAKNQGIDARKLVQDLRDRGIAVLASGILCMEHHTPENMQEDIDFLVGLEADFVQFMLLTPIPVTAPVLRTTSVEGCCGRTCRFRSGTARNASVTTTRHSTTTIPEKWINRAFRQDYEENSSSMFRMAETAVRGYEHLAAMTDRDVCLEARLSQCRDKARSWSLILPAVARNAVNPLEKSRSTDLYDPRGPAFRPESLGACRRIRHHRPGGSLEAPAQVSSVTACSRRRSSPTTQLLPSRTVFSSEELRGPLFTRHGSRCPRLLLQSRQPQF